MSLILDIPASVERDRQRQAVRSRLSPEERYKFDRGGYKTEFQNALFSDAEQKKVAGRFDGDRDRTNQDSGIGMPIHSSVFIQRLTQLNPSLWFERANADQEKIGIYLQIPPTDVHPEGLKYLFAFHDGIMPEFVLLRNPGEDGEKAGILRQGWRTILARLIRLRLISLEKVEVMFGQPSCQSGHWAVLSGKRNSL